MSKITVERPLFDHMIPNKPQAVGIPEALQPKLPRSM